MSLTSDVQNDLMSAVKEGNSVEADILRMVLASLKNAKIDQADGSDLSEEDEVSVVFAESKKVKDSIEKFEAGGRDDLVEREKAQLEVIQRYLPDQADEDEIRKVVEQVVEQTGASNPGQMGMVMGTAMKELQGRADGKVVSEIVKDVLS